MSSSYGNKLARALISTQGHLKACKNIKISFNPWLIETKSIRLKPMNFSVSYFLKILILKLE